MTEAPIEMTPGQPEGRQCGRCRVVFPSDPTLYETGTPGWWLCDDCRAILITGPSSGSGHVLKRR